MYLEVNKNMENCMPTKVLVLAQRTCPKPLSALQGFVIIPLSYSIGNVAAKKSKKSNLYDKRLLLGSFMELFLQNWVKEVIIHHLQSCFMQKQYRNIYKR